MRSIIIEQIIKYKAGESLAQRAFGIVAARARPLRAACVGVRLRAGSLVFRIRVRFGVGLSY